MNKEESGADTPINRYHNTECAENIIKGFYADDIVRHIGAIS